MAKSQCPNLSGWKRLSVPSREKGRDVPCRLIKPHHGGEVQGVFMHIHGGGWVLMTEKEPFPEEDRKRRKVAVVSIGYRIAPEHPFPQGPEDSYDAAEWLVDNAQSGFGAPVIFTGGESAGAQLITLTTFHLLKTRPTLAFNALILSFGPLHAATPPQRQKPPSCNQQLNRA
ncbi:hypothetical protein OEA41_009469 [Lepraria neglecta]|uniref:Alpha/beta hydrolase fold-3 domain-containing protein n=1 Tax=Lepraria neglecta TaxID=209136 RepID=A0AAD9Z1Q1_9LECA|nr:hypothetical protein OEA41_009469 [Lepraria neglecta]